MKYLLNDAYKISRTGEKIYFTIDNKRFSVKLNSKIENILNSIILSKIVDSPDLEEQFVSFLIEKKIIIPEFKIPDKKLSSLGFYIAQFHNNPTKVLEIFSKKNIAILGVGGIGQVVLEQLAASGFKNFILIDYDIVNFNNFNRQFLVEDKDIGKPKISVVCEKIKKRFLDLNILTISKKISKKEDLSDILNEYNVDFFSLSADYPIGEIKKLVYSVCQEKSIPCGSCSVALSKAVIGPIIDYRYIYSIPQNIVKEKILYRKVLSASNSFTNSLAGVIYSYEIFNYFFKEEKCKILGKELLFDFNSFNSKIISENILKK